MKCITEDDTQPTEFDQLTPEEQVQALAYWQAQFDAVPSYVETQAKQFASEQEGGATCRG